MTRIPPEDEQTLAETLQGLRAAAPGFVRRQLKTIGQVRFGWNHKKQVSFVFGCQRSGTKMLMRVLDRSPHTRIFHENHASAFRNFELRSDRVLRTLVRVNPAPAQVFKPICDSHKADLLMERFPHARAVWIYRHPEDVANSADVKWGAHQADLARAVATGDLHSWGWRTERLSDELVDTIRRVYRPDLSPAEGALLFWYMRNSFFFSLGLDRDPRVRLVRYEDLVTAPESAFAPVLEHLGVPMSPDLFDKVRPSSIRRRAPPQASDEIRALCLDLQARLDEALARQEAATSQASPAETRSILILINCLDLGGAERYAVTIANWMAANGVRVSVAGSDGVLRQGLDPRVAFHDAPLRDVRWDLPRASMIVREVIQLHRPDAIIANSLAAAWVARAAQGLHRIPIVSVGHGWPADRYSQVAPLMGVVDRVVAVSPEVKRKLIGGGLAPERCTVIFNGVDCRPLGPRQGQERTQARALMQATDEDLLVINVGRLSAQKAHHHMLTVASRLRGELPRLRWAVVGPGEREEELLDLRRQLGLEDIFTFLGARQDVPLLLGSADLYLSSSDWEGMPLSTIEGMASGLPCVATRTEGTTELLDADSGVIVAVGDVDAMAAEVARLARDSERRLAMGMAARTRAQTHFSHDRMTRELLAVVEAAIAD